MIRRQVTIDTSARAVWAALTTPEGLAAWLTEQARVDGRQGGRVVWTLKGGGEEIGMLHTFRPTSKVEITFEKRGEGAWKGSLLAFLVGRDRNETVVNIQHDGPAMDDPNQRAGVDDFWRNALNRLRDGLESAV